MTRRSRLRPRMGRTDRWIVTVLLAIAILSGLYAAQVFMF